VNFDAPTWQGGLKTKYFNDDESHLPNVELNDVVLLVNVMHADEPLVRKSDSLSTTTPRTLKFPCEEQAEARRHASHSPSKILILMHRPGKVV
jgi:hypothetical protein